MKTPDIFWAGLVIIIISNLLWFITTAYFGFAFYSKSPYEMILDATLGTSSFIGVLMALSALVKRHIFNK